MSMQFRVTIFKSQFTFIDAISFKNMSDINSTPNLQKQLREGKQTSGGARLNYIKESTVEPLLTKDSRYEISNLRNVFL